ncbi:MAG: PilC/PilY family type IV pilus protein [Comamonas sp.]
MPRTKPFPYKKNLLAFAIGAALAPATSWALDLVQEPPLPTSKSAFVAPNVIISIDDSGSMDWRVTPDKNGSYTSSSSNTGPGYTEPDASGNWNSSAKRINVLKYSLNTVFNDKTLIPDNKIRIAWQAMHNNGNSSGAGNVNSTSMKTNSMRPIDAAVGKTTQRANFLDFINNVTPGGGTPSHTMFSQADGYMRQPLSKNSPWSTDPGGTGSKSTEYLGCRRNYHIMMTDGVWNGTATGGNQDGTDWPALGDRQAYSTTSDQTRAYYDNYSNTLSDWAFKSWMDPLQDAGNLKDSDKLKPSKIYQEAPASENFTATKKTGTTNVQPCLAWKYGKPKTDANCTTWTQQDVFETKTVDLQKYWNPKYDPATWPHMATYTIGFSNQAVTWNLSPDIIAPSNKVPFGFTDGFVDLVTGWTQWPDLFSNNHHKSDTNSDRPLDLWHASINGRGQFYAVTESADLAKAFSEIIGKINEESAPLPDSIAGGGSTSGYNVSQNNAGIFASVYSPKNAWSGYITATRAVEPEEYACPTADDPDKKCIRFPDTIAGWEGKTSADRLDALTSVDGRLILSWSDETSKGIPFKWASTGSYSTAQKKVLLGINAGDTITTALDTQGQNIVNYIRGDRSLEGTTPDKPLRVRFSREGDIVNSEIWYTGGPISNYGDNYSAFVTAQKDRTPILYVGGNDGMLHGFSALDGNELIAYVPRGVVGNLKALTDKDYQHQYYVDGSPMTGDVLDGSTWKTMLVGTLGAGGKGYFLMNVTNPASFSTDASDLVVLDRSRGNAEPAPNCGALSGAEQAACNAAVAENKDIGNITAKPGRNPANLQEATQITRLNNGRWAVVMGNGYNSTNQRPVLLVQYLDGDLSLKRIQATTDATGSGNAADNGLASPALIDLDGDGKTDVVYAGDNLGNLWKFDLTSANDSDWAVAFGNNKPLFTARGPATLGATTRDQVQPITAPPIVRANDRMMTVGTGASAKTVPIGGVMVAFGTGRNLTANDRRTDITQPVQTLYSVLDNTRYRTKAGQTYLEVHPGTGDCGSNPTCVPTPAPVGTIANDGKPLAQQSITTVDGDFSTVTATKELKKETWKDYKGWYLDLPYSGERLLKPMQFFDGSNILAVYTETPNGTKNSESDNINESCVPVKVDTSAGSQFRTLINIMDGKRPSIPLVDYNGDGVYNADDKNVARAAVKTGTPLLITKPNNIVDLTGGGGGKDTLARMPEQSTRPSWRQLQ